MAKGDFIESVKGTFMQPVEDTEILRNIEAMGTRLISQGTKPFRRMADIYEDERLAGRALVEKSISDEPQSVWKRMLNLGLGTAQYTLSPLTSLAKAGVKEPIEEALYEGVGVPEEYAEFAGLLGEEAVYMVPFGSAVKYVMMRGEPGLKAAQEAAAIQKSLKPVTRETGKTPEEFFKLGEATPTDKREAVRQAIDAAPEPVMKTEGLGREITKPRVKQEMVKDITTGAVKALEGQFDESQRIFRQVGEKLALGEISTAGLPEILKKHNLTPVQFAKMYEETISYGGRILGYHSRARKELLDVFKDSPEASALLQNAFNKEAKQPYMIDKFLDGYGKVENFRRGMLVGQVATSIRNAWSQAGRISISTLDEAIQGVTRGTVGGQGNSYKQMVEGLNTLTASMNRLKPQARKRLEEVLETNHAVLSKMRLFNQPVHEVQLGGKISYAVNTLNRAQEFFFRRIGFEAKLRQTLSGKGLDFDTIDPKHIPEDMMEESVNYALEMTFASSPKSKAMQNIVKAWTQIPGLTLVNPFPRFNFASAIPFMFEHSPAGYLKAFRPETIKKLASGKPEEFAKYASRATIGSLMLDQAVRFRNSEYAGDKWYEIKAGEKVIDTRAFAPFSTYLLVAEAMQNPERLKPKDYAQAAIGLNRVAGTGLVVADWLRAGSGETLKKQVKNFVGQYLSGFTVPLRTASDIYSATDKEEQIYRDYRDSPFIAPTLLNLPKLSQLVPERKSSLKTARMRKGEPIAGIPPGVFRQATGLTVRTKTQVEKEIDQIGLPWTAVSPRTGIPEADRRMSEYMAPIVEKLAPAIMRSESYKAASIPLKRLIIAEGVFKPAKRQAKAQLAKSNPDLAIEVGVKGLSADKEKIVREAMQPQKGTFMGRQQ